MRIKLEDINRAVVEQYRTALTQTGIEGADVVAEDVRAPIIRPCGKVELDDNSGGALMEHGAQRSATFLLYWFATSRVLPKLENLTVRQAVEDAFIDGVMLEDIHIPLAEDLDFTVSDGVLICTVELSWYEHRGEDDGEIMETLYYNEEVRA